MAASAHALNDELDSSCFNAATAFCAFKPQLQHTLPWDIVYFRCLEPGWTSIASDDKLLRMLLVMPRTTSILAYALLSIFILGSAVQAFNQDWDNECVNAAEALCSSLATMRHSPSWDSALYHCLAPHWIDMPNDGNGIPQCAARNTNCRCYEGCIADRHADISDFAAWCSNACRISREDAPTSCS
ncbi:hypothetical protein OC842_004637 [Tilletia horrida]|uniref:Uncharacterized protein n=1 Tax=Tilletia horrida TaxID=155126 RepID=A0AAN6G9E1_9BASI|nr:hypothetical protein OC842_004637 [Tilletia horrida]